MRPGIRASRTGRFLCKVGSILGTMGGTKRGAGIKTIHSWKQARVLLERWRKNLQTVQVELKRPRAIDAVPIDFIGGEPVEREEKPQQRFRGQVIYFTSADVTFRRPSGAILVIDNYEIVAISDGKTRFEPV